MHLLIVTPPRVKIPEHTIETPHRLVVFPEELSPGLQRGHPGFCGVEWSRWCAEGRRLTLFGVERRGSRILRLFCEPSVPINAVVAHGSEEIERALSCLGLIVGAQAKNDGTRVQARPPELTDSIRGHPGGVEPGCR